MCLTRNNVIVLTAVVVTLLSLSGLVRAAQPTGYQFPGALKTVELGPQVAGMYDHLYRSARFSGGDRLVIVFAKDRADSAGSWNYFLGRFSTSLWIVDVGWRNGGDILYVAGITDDGTAVVEEWSFTPRTGGWAHTAPDHPPSIGTSAGEYHGMTTIVGGTYIQPSSETILPPRRKVIYRGTGLGEIGAIAADPEGRFLLLRSHSTKAVYRLDLAAQPPMPIPLFTPADIPHLQKATRMFVQSHAALGRACQIVDGAPWGSAEKYTILIDGNNDGLFEDHQTISKKDWLNSAYAIESYWTPAYELEG